MKYISAAIGLVAIAIVPAAVMAADSGKSASFVKEAIQGDNSEIMLGKLAQQRGGSDGVRSFGKILADDHGRAKQQMMDVAKDVGVQATFDPTPEAKDEYTKLSKMSGADFDREFVSYMVDDHKKDIAKFQDESKANDGKVSQLAAQQLPTLQKHLQIAQSLQQSAGK